MSRTETNNQENRVSSIENLTLAHFRHFSSFLAKLPSANRPLFMQNKANLFVMSTASLRLRSGQGCVLRKEFEKTKPILRKLK